MEVAMSTPLSSSIALPARLLALALMTFALTGCSDMITYAQRNRDVGIDAYNQADYPKAAGAFRAALRQDPRDYQSNFYLGLSSLQMQNYQEAIVAFRSSLETQNVTLSGKDDNATRMKSLDGLAQAIVKADDSDNEINKVEQAARSSQGASAAREFYILAKIHRYRMLPDMALDYYNRASLNDPKNFDYAKEYGLYCEQLQQRAKAQEALRHAYAIYPGDKEVTDALQRQGIVPGPSLKDKDELAKPLIPRGPIPEVDMAKVKSSLGIGSDDSKPTAPPTRTATTPRD
jgi:tetratricopeptide (TPR) repeat protein